MSNKLHIPSWQRAQTSTATNASTSEQDSRLEIQSESAPAEGTEESTTTELQPKPTSLLEQASRFLEDPTIRDAPREKKIAFLQSKGVEAEDIAKLLSTEKEEETIVDLSTEGERAWSTAPSKAPTPKVQPQDIPPIVTYPEFLTQSTKPPPLITTQRLLNTAYITGGLMASLYGLSKYIIEPMAQNLADSRHDFSSHAQEQLALLNNKLGEAVSTDPASEPKSKPKSSNILDDISETDSDPTELFHRDFGTQTTPSLSRRPSLASTSNTEVSAVTAHENRLKILTSHLRELESSQANDGASLDSLRTKLSDLTTYLGEMSYQNQYYSGSGGIYASNYGLPKTKDGKDDQIEILKADIRAVKGVFLSARNFPAGARNAPRVGA